MPSKRKKFHTFSFGRFLRLSSKSISCHRRLLINDCIGEQLNARTSANDAATERCVAQTPKIQRSSSSSFSSSKFLKTRTSNEPFTRATNPMMDCASLVTPEDLLKPHPRLPSPKRNRRKAFTFRRLLLTIRIRQCAWPAVCERQPNRGAKLRGERQSFRRPERPRCWPTS